MNENLTLILTPEQQRVLRMVLMVNTSEAFTVSKNYSPQERQTLDDLLHSIPDRREQSVRLTMSDWKLLHRALVDKLYTDYEHAGYSCDEQDRLIEIMKKLGRMLE